MSADNWTICPQCCARAEKRREAMLKKAADSYGKISPEEYLKLREEAQKAPNVEPTLREDYEIGMDETGFFEVAYSCACRACGFAHKHEHSERAFSA